MNFISEQQKQIVLSEDKYKLINGCAGSRKTDTLIKCAIVDLTKNKRPIEFLTLVGSVTDEIKTRLEKELNITIQKQGISNHYVGYYNEIPICISNYDAWVHLMLENTDGLSDIAECYNEKVDILCKKTQTESLLCYMKNNTKVGLLIIDEVQDLSSVKMNIITNLSVTHPDLDIYCAGDYLQTLFLDDASVQTMDVHSMNLFKRIHPTFFDLSKCLRCPKAHVDFNNLLLGDIQKKYMIPPMQTDNDNMMDKPFLFTHYKASDNTNARITAEQVTYMIEILMTKDVTIVPDDIAVIMAKSNGNEIFFQLQDTLPKMYEQRGHKDCVLCMSTYGDGVHHALDWNKAKGKTKLLSIHGDKGRGHKVVFFLGLTEKSIPRDIFIFKPSEIISESLLNVGLTRSTKYLFIGFTHSLPSRYLLKKSNKLDSFVYSSWSNDESLSEPYKTIRISLNNPLPLWMQYNPIPLWIRKNYKEDKMESGVKTKLEVKNDISKVFEQTKNIVMYPWKKEAICISFGNSQTIRMQLQEEHNILLGLMSELLIQRISNKDNLFDLLQSASKSENNIYTDDERFLSCMYDVKFKLDLNIYFLEYKLFFDNNQELKRQIQYAVSQNKNVVHSIFQSLLFRQDLEAFLSSVSNKELKTESIWNVTLFHNQIRNKIYRPAINSCLGFFNEEISILHENIDAFIQEHINDASHFEEELYLDGKLTPSEMTMLKKDPKKDLSVVSINGRCDIYDTRNQRLYEIKASRMNGYSQEWLTQTVLYTLMLEVYNKPVKEMFIVNVLKGCLWKWTLPNLSKIEDVLSNKICKKYEWHHFEIYALIAGIECVRKTLKK